MERGVTPPGVSVGGTIAGWGEGEVSYPLENSRHQVSSPLFGSLFLCKVLAHYSAGLKKMKVKGTQTSDMQWLGHICTCIYTVYVYKVWLSGTNLYLYTVYIQRLAEWNKLIFIQERSLQNGSCCRNRRLSTSDNNQDITIYTFRKNLDIVVHKNLNRVQEKAIQCRIHVRKKLLCKKAA